MKLAISGKGGVGKTTVAAALALLMAEQGVRVLAVDADPDANLAAGLGIPRDTQETLVPIAARKALIEERTGAKVKQYGQMFKLNPEVADLAGVCGYEHRGVVLLVLGAIESGGSGCACPESVLLRALVTDLVLHKDEALVLDMEAGIEHLGRGTARGVDAMLVIVEPGQRALDCALRVAEMARAIGIRKVLAVANKVGSEGEADFVRAGLADVPLLATLPVSAGLRACDRDGRSVLDGMEPEVRSRFAGLLAALQEGKA